MRSARQGHSARFRNLTRLVISGGLVLSGCSSGHGGGRDPDGAGIGVLPREGVEAGTVWGDAAAPARDGSGRPGDAGQALGLDAATACPCASDPLSVPVADYGALRAYSGAEGTLCVLHPRSCGRFVRVQACSVDNGTCLKGSAGRWWQRPLGDPPVLRPRFWEETEGASGLLPALQAAQARPGAAVELDRVYELHAAIPITSGTRLRGGGLRRRCTPHAIVTAPVAPSDRCLRVDEARGFQLGSRLVVLAGRAYAQTRGELVLSSAGEPALLCAPQALGFTAAVGQEVIEVFDLMAAVAPSGVSAPLEDVVISDMLFDGNRGCNGFTADWRYNGVGALRGRVTFVNNTIIDTPGEALTSCGGVFLGNHARNLGGSFVHKSCAAAPPPRDRIENNEVIGVNLLGDALMGHSEGAITLSAHAGELVVLGNTFRDGREGVFGLASGDDGYIVARRNVFERFARRISYGDGLSAAALGVDIDEGNTWLGVD